MEWALALVAEQIVNPADVIRTRSNNSALALT